MTSEEKKTAARISRAEWFPSIPPDDDLYVIYSIGGEFSQEWQAELLDFSLQRVNQPGTLIRLVSGEPRPEGRKPPLSANGYTLVTPEFHPGLKWPVINKVGSLEYLFRVLDPEFVRRNRQSTLLFLDPDMIFSRPWDPAAQISEGNVYGQRWVGYGKDYCLRTSNHGKWCPASHESCIMYPFAISLCDMEKLAPTILDHALVGYRKSGEWMTDMTAFVTAMTKENLNVTCEDGVGLCNNWPNRDDEDAPILHYCQPARDRKGKEIWSKTTYTPWSGVPSPSQATNRVDREVFTRLRQLVELKKTLYQLTRR